MGEDALRHRERASATGGGVFRRVHRARRRASAEAIRGLIEHACEDYRHRLIAEAVPASRGSLTQVGTGSDVDTLMAHVATLAHDYEAAMRWSLAPGKRLARMCEAEVWQLWSIENGLPHASRSKALTPGDYIQGIVAKAGWAHALYASGGEWWLDLDLIRLDKLLKMLDTHRHRLLVQAPRKRELDAYGKERRMRLAFELHACYHWKDGILWKTLEEAHRKPLVNIRVTA